MDIGNKIKTARIAKGMTQEELGKQLGVQKSAIAKYESGRVVNIKRSTLKKISDILDIRASELIFDEEQKQSTEGELSEVKRALIDLIDGLSESEAAVLLASLRSGLGR
jgi:transcriptional regulator with XRE-family HTH domain